MIEEHARFVVDPATATDFEAAVEEAIPVMLTAEGCVSAHLTRSVDRDGVYLMRVVWKNLTDHTEKFPASEQARACAALFAHYIVESPKVTHYELPTT